jgi:hypothetical protein
VSEGQRQLLALGVIAFGLPALLVGSWFAGFYAVTSLWMLAVARSTDDEDAG